MRSVEITIERRADEQASPERRPEDRFPITIREIESGSILTHQKGTLHFTVDTRRELTAVMDTDPLKYGNILGQAIFQDRVKALFEAALGRARDADMPLRVWLVVEDQKTLGAVRWKRLCAPIDNTWPLLALCQEAPLSLYLGRETYRPYPPLTRRDLRSVLLVSSPSEEDNLQLATFDVESTAKALTTAMEPGIKVDLLASTRNADGPPTLDSLMKWLTENRPTLLHLVCHGIRQGDETVLFLTGADGKFDTVSGSTLIERLRTLQHLPHFAFLSACQSASPVAEWALGGLAQRLVSDLGMKAVVAMTENVPIPTAGELSTEFYRWLQDHGEPDRALVQATAGLVNRPGILVPALYSSLRHLPLLDEVDIDTLSAADIDFGLTRLTELLKTRAPVLLTTVGVTDDQKNGPPTPAEVLRATAPDQLEKVSADARAAWLAARAEIDSISKESLGLSFASLASGIEPPRYDGRQPFLGLSPFSVADRAFFFGRGQLVEDLRKQLLAQSFLAILGQSGSGKSSLVFAGLIPHLLKNDPALAWESFRPGNSPVEALTAASAALPDDGGLLVVDQCEEIFTHTRDKDVRSLFFDQLLTETTKRTVVVTMRAEFLADCEEHEGFDKLVKAHLQRISPMSPDELRHAIEEQANVVGMQFEAGLAATIIEEIRDEPGAMPLLQHALLELWRRRHGTRLKLSEYRALGGVRKAISGTAEAVYQRLTPIDQERVRNIFLRLTQLDGTDSGDSSARDTRRRVPFRHLVQEADDLAAVRKLVNELQSAGLLVVTPEKPHS